MKRVLTIGLLIVFSLVNAQTITFKGCLALFDDQNFTFNQTGIDGTARSMFATTPIDSNQPCGGVGNCEFKIQWSVTNSRWEFTADDGKGDFSTPFVIYYNTSGSLPNPPSLNLGSWLENVPTTNNLCLGPLSNSNATLTGELQDNLLSNANFAINKNIQVYPNPVHDFLTIKSVNEIKNIEIWNMQGQKMDSAIKNLEKIDISRLQNGLYIIRVKTDNELQVSQFIKK